MRRLRRAQLVLLLCVGVLAGVLVFSWRRADPSRPQAPTPWFQHVRGVQVPRRTPRCEGWEREGQEQWGAELESLLLAAVSTPVFPALGRKWDWCHIEWKSCEEMQHSPLSPSPPPSASLPASSQSTPSTPPFNTTPPKKDPPPFPPFLLRPVCTPRERLLMLFSLHVFHQICAERNLTYFLVGGTLLGSLRHHGFIPWDDDMDVFLSLDQRARAERALSSCGPCFFWRGPNHHCKFFLRGITKKGISGIRWPFIDLYFYSENGTHLWHKNEEMTLAKEDVFPLTQRPFEGGFLWAPRKPAAVLGTSFNSSSQLCVSSRWCHKDFLVREEEVSLPCSALQEFLPFVGSSPQGPVVT